jgi:glycerophosphoryl diester phosphodiesterase
VTVAIQAHRGSPDPSGGISENTIEAFAHARRLGADGVEFDVRVTADGALVIHHDPNIPGVGRVVDLEVHQLPDHVPLLAAAFGACAGMTVNVEVKNLPTEANYDPDETAARAVANVIAGADLGEGVVVSSFWPPSLDAVLAIDPALATGLLLADWADPTQSLMMAQDMGVRALHLHQSLVTVALVEETHAAGLKVAVWTVNDPESMMAMATCGVDAIITDDVALAVATIRVT